MLGTIFEKDVELGGSEEVSGGGGAGGLDARPVCTAAFDNAATRPTSVVIISAGASAIAIEAAESPTEPVAGVFGAAVDNEVMPSVAFREVVLHGRKRPELGVGLSSQNTLTPSDGSC